MARVHEVSALNFHTDGVEIRRNIVSCDDIDLIKSDISLGCEKLKKYGIRNLEKRFDSIARLASSPNVLTLAEALLGARAQLVRALFFDKTPDMNWFVAWHQDRTVTLNKRCVLSGWRAWSNKEGVWHVQPPSAVLDKMITLRIHLDAADANNGCLKVITGSHFHGVLKQETLTQLVADSTPIDCVVAAGDVVIMRPHVVHSSGKSQSSTHRRVVHLEFSSYSLPSGISWA